MNALIAIAHSLSPTEAALVRNRLESEGIHVRLEGEATGNMLWHMGPSIAGVSVLVGHDDADHAQQVLTTATEGLREDAEGAVFENDFLTGDEAAAAADDFRHDVSPEVLRAWRAAVLGVVIFPPLLTLYSTWVLFRQGKALGGAGERNWRVAAAYAINATVLVASAVGLLFFFMQ